MNFASIINFIKKRFLPNLPYFMMAWLGNKVGEAFRLAPGASALEKVVYSAKTLGNALARPVPSFEKFDMLAGIAFAASMYAIVVYRKKNAKKWRKNIEYGSARFGNAKDIAPYMDAKPDNNIILTATESLTLNGRPKKSMRTTLSADFR